MERAGTTGAVENNVVGRRRWPVVFAAAAALCACATVAPASAGASAALSAPFGGSGAARAFGEVSAPAVTSISPKFGQDNTENLVRITGTSFTGATAVDFGTTPAVKFTVESDSEISAMSPTGSGPVDVTVTTRAGTSETTRADVYTYTNQPHVEELEPATGPEAGGNGVYVIGSGLNQASNVKFGSANAEITEVISSYRIIVKAPAGTGSVDVIVTAEHGTSEKSPGDVYSYTRPQLTGFSPEWGGEKGGTTVTITGTSFEGATAVTFGGKPAESFTVDSPKSITVVTPPATGEARINVITPHGDSEGDNAEGGFAYEPPATVTGESVSGLTATSAITKAEVETNHLGLSECRFEYGTSTEYGASAPCTALLKENAPERAVSANVTGLARGVEYHYRAVVTNDSGTVYGSDQTFTTRTPPEYGTCVKGTAGSGLYATLGCTSQGTTKAFEWYPAFGSAKPLTKRHFTTKSKEGVEAKLQTSGGQLIACKAESGGGEYTGNATVGGVTMTFTGCQLATSPCQSSGSAAGEVSSSTLHGVLGVIGTSTEGAAKNHIGLDLKPVPGEAFASFSCGSTAVTVTGSVIGEVAKGTMTTKESIKFVQARGVQKPSRLEGGEEDVLVTKLGEGAPQRTGLSMTATQINEQGVEVNSVV